MKKIFLILVCSIVLNAEDTLQIEAEINSDMSSTYFAYIDFDFENTSQEWQILEDVQISFGDDKDQYIEVLNGQKYNEWLKSTIVRNKEREANRQIALAILGGFGGAMIGSDNNVQLGQTLVSGAVAFETLAAFNKNVSAKKRAETLPENHIYKDTLIIPPGLTGKRFIVINSKDHKKLGYINKLKLAYKQDGKLHTVDLKFRGNQYQNATSYGIPGNQKQNKNKYVWESDI